MTDVAPELHRAIERDFLARIRTDSLFQTLYRKVKKASATHGDAAMLADRAGQLCFEVLQKHLTAETLPDGTLYYNIARRTIGPALEDVHELTDAACIRVQTNLNRKAGIGIKAQSVAVDAERVNGIVSSVVDAETLTHGMELLDGSTVTFARRVVDDSIEKNAAFQGQSGLETKLIREAEGGCCEWCDGLAGSYRYSDVLGGQKDVFRRHKGCRCVVSIEAVGVWNVVPGRWPSQDRDPEKIAARKKMNR